MTNSMEETEIRLTSYKTFKGNHIAQHWLEVSLPTVIFDDENNWINGFSPTTQLTIALNKYGYIMESVETWINSDGVRRPRVRIVPTSSDVISDIKMAITWFIGKRFNKLADIYMTEEASAM